MKSRQQEGLAKWPYFFNWFRNSIRRLPAYSYYGHQSSECWACFTSHSGEGASQDTFPPNCHRHDDLVPMALLSYRLQGGSSERKMALCRATSCVVIRARFSTSAPPYPHHSAACPPLSLPPINRPSSANLNTHHSAACPPLPLLQPLPTLTHTPQHTALYPTHAHHSGSFCTHCSCCSPSPCAHH